MTIIKNTYDLKFAWEFILKQRLEFGELFAKQKRQMSYSWTRYFHELYYIILIM